MATQEASLIYFKVPEMGPAAYKLPNAGELTADTQWVPVHDVRGQEDKFNIDVQGFQFVKHDTKFTDWDNIPALQEVYYEEVKELVKKHFGATKVAIDCHNRRGANHKVTIGRAHIDRTPKSSRERLFEAVGEEEQERMNKENQEYLLMSVWRPLKPVVRDPLIFCDKRTVDNEKDLADMPRPLNHGAQGNAGRLYWIRNNPNHVWYQMEKQDIDDVVFIKLVDYREGKERVGVPHSSAVLRDTDHLPARESVEVRVVATFD